MKKQAHSHRHFILLTGIIGFSFFGFQVSEAIDQPPTVTTQSVSGIGTTMATGNGNITDMGDPNPEQYGICWSTSSSPTTGDNKTEEGNASATGPFTSILTGLSPYTTYYVRAYATNSAGTSYGNEVSFSTNATLTTATTQAVSGIKATKATGNGTITAMGVPDPSHHGICWNTTGSPLTSDNKTDEGPVSETGAFTSEITGLNPETTYYARAYVTNKAGTTYGIVLSFSTPAASPATISTQDVTNIETTTATGNVYITDLGDPHPEQYGICWNTAGSPTTGDNKTEEGSVSATGAFTSELTELNPNTTYYARAYAINLAGTSYGAEVSFTTEDIVLPEIAFTEISSEGVESLNTSNLQVELSGAFTEDVSVAFAISGTATGGGTDHNLGDGMLIISAGETSNIITIAGIVDDNLVEGDETVIVTLSNPVNANLGINSVHTYTIRDNDATSGLDNISAQEIEVFPNPCTDRISILGTEKNIMLTITNISGQMVIKTRYNQGDKLDISHLQNGIYFIHIGHKEGTTGTIRIIKQ